MFVGLGFGVRGLGNVVLGLQQACPVDILIFGQVLTQCSKPATLDPEA